MKGRRIPYSATEMAWLEANRSMLLGDYHRAFQAVFDRPAATAVNLNSLRKRKGWLTGRTGHFVKGGEPLNKGKACPEGTGGRHPNARLTQFRKGERPHTYRGPGHERIDQKDGYVILIVAETNPWSGAKTRPVHKHRWLWEKANGPIPEGCVLKCRDGDKTNTDPSNWFPVERGVLSRLNGGRHKTRPAYAAVEPELKPTVLALAEVEQAALRRRKPKAVG